MALTASCVVQFTPDTMGKKAQVDAAKAELQRATLKKSLAKGVMLMIDGKIGVKAALKLIGKSDGATQGKLQGAIDRHREAEKRQTRNLPELTPYANLRLLCAYEEEDLVEWIIAQNLKLQGKDTDEITKQILLYLKVRLAVHRRKRGRDTEPLSAPAMTALTTQKVSPAFFLRFDKLYAHRLKKGKQANVDSKKAAKATIANAEKILTVGSHSLFRELTELPDENGKPLVGTINPNSGKPIRPIIDPKTGEWTKWAGPGTSDGRCRLLQIDEALVGLSPDEVEASSLLDSEHIGQVMSPSKLGKRPGSLEYYKIKSLAQDMALQELAVKPVLPSDYEAVDLPGKFHARSSSVKSTRFTNVSEPVNYIFLFLFSADMHARAHTIRE